MKKIFLYIFLFLVVVAQARDFEDIRKTGVIYAAFTHSSKNSINYQIAKEFAKFLNVKLVPVITTWQDNFSNNGYIPPDLQTNPSYSYTPDALKKADFICGTIYVYEWRKKLFDYAGIVQVSDLLIVRKNRNDWSFFTKMIIPEEYLNSIKTPEIKTYEDLRGKKIALLQNSSYEKNMAKINEKLGNTITIIRTKSEEEAQQLLKEGKVDGFVAVSYLALKFLKENPSIAKLAFPVGKPFDVGWAVEKGNKKLIEEINNFFETIRGNGTLDKFFQQYYGIDYKTYLEIINSFSEANFNSSRDLDEILASGKIYIGLRERELIYHKSGKKQFSHKLAEAFASYLNVEMELKIAPSISAYFEDDEGKIVKDSSYTPKFFDSVDVACDILAPLPWRLKKVDIIPYLPNAIVVIGKKGKKITTVADLKKLRGVTAKGTSYEQALINNGITNYFYAPLNKVLDLVQNGKADYTLVSISIYNLPDYPDLEAKFILGEIMKNGWAIKKNHPKLRQKILEFFEYADKVGIIDNYFREQTGMPFRAAEKYLTALHQTYNIGYFPFVFYGTEQGLPQEDVLTVFQDSDGYIWFGTFAGAVKFNGRKMIVFNKDNGLISNEVFDIKEDDDKNIYFATLKGISAFKNDSFSTIVNGIPFKHIFIDDNNRKWFFGDNELIIYTDTLLPLNKRVPQLPKTIHSIAQIKNSQDFLIASSEGLFLFNFDNFELDTLLNDYVYYVFVDKNYHVWLSAKSGIYYKEAYLVKKGKIGEPINKKLGINEVIHQIYQTNDEAIWLISNFKIYQIFTLNQAPIVYDSRVGLSGNKIYTFFVDNEENYWFGIAGGVLKLTNKSLRIIYPKTLKFYVNKIIQDKYNQFWFAFNNSLYVLGDSLVNLTNKFYPASNTFAVEKLKNGNILVATTSGIFEVDPSTFKIIRQRKFNPELLYVRNIFISSEEEIFILTGRNGVIYYLEDFNSPLKTIENSSTTLVYQLLETNDTIFGGNNNGLIFFDKNKKIFKHYKITDFSIWTIKKINNKIYLGTDNGLYFLTPKRALVKKEIRGFEKISITAIAPSSDTNYLWIGTNQGFGYLNLNNWKIEFILDAKDGLPGNEIAFDGLLLDAKGKLWIGTLHGLATYDIKRKSSQKYTPDCRIEAIILNKQKINKLPKQLKHYQNNLIFELTGLSFKNEESLVYDYYLRGKNKIYPSSSAVPYIAAYQNLPPGEYVFLYRAKGKDGIWSYYKSIKFEILKPFWLRWWFLLIAMISVIITIYFIIKLRERALRLRNEELERLVKERTKQIELQKAAIEAQNAELQQQKEEIIAQRDELARQRDIARRQRDEIAKQQQEIMDSIYYAKKIQAAMLPPLDLVRKYLPEFFVLYKPRDIVSGDFYWFKKVRNQIVVVAGDCTGHGVPGAFMSMLGMALLEEVVWQNRDNLIAGRLLDNLRTRIVSSLHQTGKIEETKDGMDMALYIIDKDKDMVQFAGAFNPLYIIRNDELIEIPADRMPIGIYEGEHKTFTTHNVKVYKNDLLYTFSDGYASQFGGKKGKKFKNSRLKKLFLTIKDRPIEEQKKLLEKTLENWMGVKYPQVDDILIIGVKYVWGQNFTQSSEQQGQSSDNQAD